MKTPATPRPSATICLLRDGAAGLEVMMGKRSSTAKFMADAWVFPGGQIDERDRELAASLVAGDNDPSQLPWILGALRETVEETGIWLTSPPRAEALGDRDVYEVLDTMGQRFEADVRYFANWITPADLPVRYDARFFAAVFAADLTPIPDMAEIDRVEWVRPADAISAAARHEKIVPFPTQVTLEQFAAAASADEFMEHVAGLEIETIQPRMKIEADGSLRVVLPSEPEFDELPEISGDPVALADAARRARGTRQTIAEIE